MLTDLYTGRRTNAGKNSTFFSSVNTLVSRRTTKPHDSIQAPSTFAERLEFVIWYAVSTLGIVGATKLSRAIGKQENTLSKWAAKQPSFEQSEILANAVGVNATWFHNPASSGAVEPDLFAQWLRSTRLAAQGREVEPPSKRRA